MYRLRRWFAALLLVWLPCLAGCGDFFSHTNKTPGCGSFFHDPSCDSGGGGGGGGGTSSGNYAFVVNNGSSTVSGLSISATGGLAVLSGSPIAVPSTPPTAAAVTRNNAFVYFGNAAQIFGSAIASTGALTPLGGGGALANGNVVDMQMTPDGNWLMALDGNGPSIDLFAVNQTTGALSAASSVLIGSSTAGTVPYHLRINPAGTAVAATVGVGGQVLWSFNTTTGAFTELSRTAAVNSLTADRGLAWDSTGSYLFLTRTGSTQGLVVERVASNGALTPTTATPYPTGNKPTNVAIDNTGTYAYVTNESDSTISGWSIGTGKALTAIAGSPFSSGVGVTSLAMDSTGKWVLASALGSSPDLTLYGFDTTNPGRLYVVSSTATGTNASFVALSH